MTDAYSLAHATLTRIGHHYDADIKKLEAAIEDCISDFMADLDHEQALRGDEEAQAPLTGLAWLLVGVLSGVCYGLLTWLVLRVVWG